jgi:transcriptional regulator with XRE-family HTH domain
MSEQKEMPFKTLGRQLKALRTRSNESLAEASGAVEIDVKQLASFELGHTRPAEDVLLLLISHFGAKDDEAVRLWEMAGYGMERIPVAHLANEQIHLHQSASATTDAQILFTDVVDITVNNYGVVMNFMQGANPQTKPSTVARVGMSREHAKSVLQILQITLDQTEKNIASLNQKQLNSENSSSENNH